MCKDTFLLLFPLTKNILDYKAAQQYDKVDEIRSYFKANGMSIKDMKHRIDWAWEE